MSSVYAMKCETTGKVYIGATRSYVSRRVVYHFFQAARGAGSETGFYADVRLYGPNDFSVVTLETDIDEVLLGVKEREWISKMRDLLTPEMVYNKRDGGETVDRSMSPEARKKISEAALKRSAEKLRRAAEQTVSSEDLADWDGAWGRDPNVYGSEN